MGIEDNKRIVHRLLADISAWNIDAALDALADDATWWVAGTVPGVSGTYAKQQMGEMFRLMRATLLPGGLNISVDHSIAEDDCVAVEGHSDAVLASGMRYRNQYHWAFELRNGKIHRAREYLDTLLVQQAGESMQR